MTYERHEDLIIAVLEMIVCILKGGKKIRVLLQKKKKSQTSTTSPDINNITSERTDEAEV